MKASRVLIAAFLFLAAGITVIFYFCHGSTGMSVGYPVDSGTKLTVDITTMGIPALVGVPMIVLGALLLLIAFIAAIVAQFQRHDAGPQAAPELHVRRHEPFAE